jgi:prepilin-type N-terminal cleavage/methylation domain-containing protein
MYFLGQAKPNVLRVLGTVTQALRFSANGFTLVELLIVLVVIAILMVIAVPAYSAFAGRARVRTAEHQISAAMTAAEAFHLDNGTYVGLGNSVKKTPPGLAFYDASVDAQVATGGTGKPTATRYCLNATVGGVTLSASAPAPVAWYQKKNCSGASSASAP